MSQSAADRDVDFTDSSIQMAYDDALSAWREILDPKGRLNGDPEVATVLEESLKDRFGISDDDAWIVSSKALRDMREIRGRE